MAIPKEQEGRKKEAEKIFEGITAQNFPILMKHIDVYIQEVQWTISKINTKRSTPRHSTVILLKIKGKKKDLENSKRKMIRHLQWNKSSNNLWLLIKNNEGLKAANDIIKVWKNKNLSTKNMSHKLSCKKKWAEKKIFPGEERLYETKIIALNRGSLMYINVI